MNSNKKAGENMEEIKMSLTKKEENKMEEITMNLNNLEEGKTTKNISIENPMTIKAVESFPSHWYSTGNREKYYELREDTKADKMIASLIGMINYTKNELKNCFSIEEAKCLYEALFQTSYSVDIANPKSYILTIIEDVYGYEYNSELFSTTIKTVMNKIKALSEFQVYTILLMFSLIYDDPNGFDKLNKCWFVEKH